jgi:GntR family transcriptional regulator
MRQVTPISIDPQDATPIYAQLERALRAAIATGRIQPGEQLPTVRQLAVELRVIETRRGVGSFISATPAEARPPREHERRLRAFVTRVLADADAAGFTSDELIAALRAHKGGA